jgi:hypothetical protein
MMTVGRTAGVEAAEAASPSSPVIARSTGQGFYGVPIYFPRGILVTQPGE